MSKISLIERNKKRVKMSKSLSNKRQKLLAVARDRNAKPEDIFEANLKLAKLPKNSINAYSSPPVPPATR